MGGEGEEGERLRQCFGRMKMLTEELSDTLKAQMRIVTAICNGTSLILCNCPHWTSPILRKSALGKQSSVNIPVTLGESLGVPRFFF